MAQTANLREAAAYTRFGLGYRAGGQRSDDPYARLLREIGDNVAQPGGGRLPSTKALLTEIRTWQRERQRVRDKSGQIPASPLGPRLFAEIDARYNGVYMQPEVGLSERLVMFWTNHFAVSRDKDAHVGIAAGAFEREAIRPHVYGRFADMLQAVETHPAMLYFLDNVHSYGPRSQVGQRRGGLNENLAREILELHTLGVRTGYSQADVTAFARAITGWTVVEDGADTGAFHFDQAAHEPGAQTIMGRVYDDAGMDQGNRVLADLAIHPATARHIATKLVRYFISDDPPQTLVDTLASTFLETGGNLKVVTRVLVQSDEALHAPLQKLRLPQDYLAAALRATDARMQPSQIQALLNRMGQPLWQPGGPNGFSDLASVWATPVSLQARILTANSLAQRTAGNRIDPRRFADVVLGPRQTGATRDIVAHADTRPQGVAIALLAPEFMRR